MKALSVTLLLTLATLSAITLASPDEFSGKVIGVTDGDTISVLLDETPITVRLARIDCPEEGQEYGKVAKQITSEFSFGKTVVVRKPKREIYRRYIGEVILPSGLNLNEELVRGGHCWWYRKYAPKERNLQSLEEEARNARLGLWQSESPIPPWNFRKGIYSPDLEAKSSRAGKVRMSKSRICHAPGTLYYHKVKKFTPYQTLQACLSAGGRLPKG